MASKFFAVSAIALVLAVAGCDQVAQFGAMVGLAPKREVVRRSPKPPATPRPEGTPRPTKSSKTIPEYVPETPVPGAYATAPPASWVEPTPVPGSSPGATVSPWLTAALVDQGNGLTKMEISSGGYGMDQRQNVFAIAGVDGEMYFLVYRWYIWFEGGPMGSFPKVYRESGAASFRLKRILGEKVEFDYVGPARLEEYALNAGWQSSYGYTDYNNSRRATVMATLAATMPATPSVDVVTLPGFVDATRSARLSNQAEGRWESGWLSLANLPWYPDSWYPLRTEFPLRYWDMVTYQRTHGIEVDHGVGSRSAFAFRSRRYVDTGYCYNEDEQSGPKSCGKDSTELGANEGPLWRLNKGEAEWKPLSVIPWKVPNKEYLGDIRNTWNQVWWSDVHQRWFFWVGAAYGDVFLATEEAAAQLK